jgi:hypothetical protein
VSTGQSGCAPKAGNSLFAIITFEETPMPTISMFYGIIIRMYFAPTEHPPPHFHVYYGEHKATVEIRTSEVIQGNLPKKQTKLVLAWAELHQEELMADWELVMNGEEPFKIQPLQ